MMIMNFLAMLPDIPRILTAVTDGLLRLGLVKTHKLNRFILCIKYNTKTVYSIKRRFMKVLVGVRKALLQ